MLFDELQKSRFAGKPVRLFVFERQGTVIGRFCNSPVDLTIGDDTYLSAQIDRSEIKETPEKAKDKITVKFACLKDPNHSAADEPVTQSLGDHWTPYVPADELELQVLHAFQEQTTDDTGVKTGTQDSSKTTISSEQHGVNPVTFVPSNISATGAFGSPPPFLNKQWSARPLMQL